MKGGTGEGFTNLISLHQARCVASIRAAANSDLFLVATVGVKGVRDLPGKSQTGAPSHDVQLLEYNEDTAEV
eukprot:768685-Hanusia_phi.AAC.4